MKFFVCLSFLLLISCATPYQSKSFQGGYSETQLSEKSFIISFKGNGYTDTERTNDFTLLRSAEVTLEHGYKYFTILDSKDYIESSTYTTPVTANTTAL